MESPRELKDRSELVPRKVYFSPERRICLGASSLAISAGRQFASEMGFEVVTPRTANAAAYYGKLFQTWMTSDVFFAMYPYFGSPLTMSNPTRSVDRSLLPILRKMRKQTKSILYVVDFPLEQVWTSEDEAIVDNTGIALERTLFSEIDILLVVNHYMKDRIIEKYGVPENKIIEFEILDYIVDFEPPATRELKKTRTIATTSAYARQDYILSWFKDVPRSPNIKWEFFGSDGEWIQSYGRDDMRSQPFMDPKSMAELLASSVDFGIICNKFDEKMDRYYNYVSTSRLGTFMTAGVPVVVPSRSAYMSEVVRKFDIGWVFNSPQELPSIIENITPAEYNHVRGHVLELGQRLKNGYFFKNAVTGAMGRLGFKPGD